MKRWVVLDRWLRDTMPDGKGLQFTSYQLSERLGVSRWESSAIIQAYLAEQRHADSYTRYWLFRQGRTSNAVWFAGARTKDLKYMQDQYVDDVGRRIAIAVAPDLDRLRVLNPKTRKVCDEIADALEEVMIKLHSLNGKA